MEEKEDIGGFLSLGINDSFNVPSDKFAVNEDKSNKNTIMTSKIKIFAVIIFLVGISYNIYAKSLAGLFIWCVSLGFIMEVMGSFDSIKKETKSISKPEGYENIE